MNISTSFCFSLTPFQAAILLTGKFILNNKEKFSADMKDAKKITNLY